MAYVVTYKGSVVAGPFSSQSDAIRAKEQKARESGLSGGVSEFKVESR